MTYIRKDKITQALAEITEGRGNMENNIEVVFQ